MKNIQRIKDHISSMLTLYSLKVTDVKITKHKDDTITIKVEAKKE